jgi:hypothetical protein
MSEWHHFSAHNALEVFHERSHVVRPLRPSPNVAARARALAMAAQVNGECPKPVSRHRLREALVPTRMVAKTMHDRERHLGVGFGPRAVRQLGSIGGRYRPFPGEGAFSRQGGRSLSRS